MTFSVWMSICLALLLPLTAPVVARRVPPATAAAGLTALALVSAAALLWGTFLVALSLYLHGVLALDPVPVPVAVLVNPLAVVLLVLGVRAAGRQWRLLRQVDEHLVADAASCPDRGVLVVGGSSVHAHAVAGLRHGRVEVGGELLAALHTDERAAMLAHERAHLRFRHGLLRSAVQVCAAVHPGLRAVPALLVEACERWADEAAATAVHDRGAVARALSRAALVTVRQPEAGLRSRVAVPFGATGVTQRVDALLVAAPSPRRGAWLVLPLLAVLGVCAWGALDGTWDTFRNLFLR